VVQLLLGETFLTSLQYPDYEWALEVILPFIPASSEYGASLSTVISLPHLLPPNL
jgi:hypothetical protein